MNIDERLAALTQSFELLASFHKDNEKRIERLAESHMRLAEGHVQLESLVTQIAEGTARLLHVVEVHEHRISDLEGNQPQQ